MADFEKVVIGNATLYRGDCMDVLPTLERVDAVITDPPYSANTHKQAKTNKGKGAGVKLVTFSAIDDAQFSDLVNMLISLCDGWVIATCDYRHAALMYQHENFVRLGAWVKPSPMPQISGDRPGQGFETVLIMHSGRHPKKWNRGGGAGVWVYPTHGDGTQVPTQKPLGLIRAFVSDFTASGQVILDCCMGSGTTGIAALEQGRKFVGIERDPGHFAIACERIEAAHNQPDMFVAQPAQKLAAVDLFAEVANG